MAPRVTKNEVQEIIETGVFEGLPEPSPFITAAHLLVENKLKNKGLSEDTLKTIELYLAAHFVAVTDPRELRTRMGESQVQYQAIYSFSGAAGLYLNTSLYGQMAVVLDTSGTLAKLGKPSAFFKVTSASQADD